MAKSSSPIEEAPAKALDSLPDIPEEMLISGGAVSPVSQEAPPLDCRIQIRVIQGQLQLPPEIQVDGSPVTYDQLREVFQILHQWAGEDFLRRCAEAGVNFYAPRA